MSRHKKKRCLRWRSTFLWHRYLGLTSALFVILLSITGLMLNHTSALQLDQRHVRSAALLDWYGITAPMTRHGYRAGGHWLNQLSERIYFDADELLATDKHLIGAVAIQGILVVAIEDQLLLLTVGGELIERLGPAEGLPAGMQAIGTDRDGLLYVRTAHGNYATDNNFFDWHEKISGEGNWSEPRPIPAALQDRLTLAYRGTGLPVERVILDIHSGRFLGSWGIYVIDVAAAMFLLLAILGIRVWTSRKKKQGETT